MFAGYIPVADCQVIIIFLIYQNVCQTLVINYWSINEVTLMTAASSGGDVPLADGKVIIILLIYQNLRKILVINY